MADAAQAIAWELEGRTLKVYLDVPLEKRQGLPSNVIFPIAKFKAMIETSGKNYQQKGIVGVQSIGS